MRTTQTTAGSVKITLKVEGSHSRHVLLLGCRWELSSTQVIFANSFIRFFVTITLCIMEHLTTTGVPGSQAITVANDTKTNRLHRTVCKLICKHYSTNRKVDNLVETNASQ